jgi:type IV/VI secretion system ImpK/VasF family protein
VTGDSENEFDSVGETPAPPPADQKAEEEHAPSRKKFRAWGAAQKEEKEEGVLGKLGKRISGIFSKPATPEANEPEAQAQSSDLELIMPEPIEPAIEAPAGAAEETPVVAADETSDFAADEIAIEPAVEPSLGSAEDSEMTFDVVPDGEPIAAAEIVPQVTEKPKRPSLIARLFGRKTKPEPSVESFELEKDDAMELQPAAADEAPELQATAPDEAPELQATAPDEVSELQATAPDDAPLISVDPQTQATLEPAFMEPDAPYAEHPTDPMLPPPIEEPTTAPIPESKGLFGRLFSRKPKVSRPIPVERPAEIEPTLEEMPALEAAEPPAADEELVRTDEHAEPAPEELGVGSLELGTDQLAEEIPTPNAELQTFSSVDEALPAEPEPSTVDLIEAALAEPLLEEEKKPGFFGRLFGRKSKPEPRPSLEIEVHEDRIEAAAHALDEVSGESFAGAPEAAEADPYASVEDALPADDTAIEEMVEPAVSGADMRFAPPPVVESAEPPAEPVSVDARSTLELEPFDPFAQTMDPQDAVDARDTVETTPDSRSTLELHEHEPRSTEEIALEAELRGEIAASDEIDRKTDEFAIPSVDTEATTGELLETETTQAAKLTWWMRLLGRKPKTDAAKAGLPAGATVVEGTPNFLFSKFKAFYNEIIRFKHQKTEFAAGFSTAILTDFNADLSPDAAAAAQSQALHQMLELQSAEAQWMGGEAKDRYPDAQYAMAVMADELFSHMEWDGQAAWRNHLLEVKLYRSHAADVELFKRIDKLLKESPNSHVARDLARVYLLVLAAGFQGKYRPFGLPRALAQYRQRLYEYIHQGDSLMLYAQDRKIFPEAASRTLEGHAVGRFSSLQRWAAILVFLVLGYTVLAHYAWNRVSADLKDVTERIRAASSTSGATTSPTSSNSTAANGGGR